MYLANVSWTRMKALEAGADNMFYTQDGEDYEVFIFNTTTNYHSYKTTLKNEIKPADVEDFEDNFKGDQTSALDYDDALAQAIGV